MTERWIIVPNWFADEHEDGLQHYRNRDPIWIKNYRRLLSKDEYLQLSGHCRGILHGLWLEYAMSDGRLRDDSSSMSSRLALRVTKTHLKLLADAGFITFSASKPLALRYQVASPEKRREEKKVVKTPSSARATIETLIRNGVITTPVDLTAELRAHNLNGTDEHDLQQLLDETAK